MTRFHTGLMAVAGGALLLSACGSKPTGQVAAKVDGDEITLTELNTELQGVNLPKGADTKLVQRQALERVIDRKLLAAAAKQDNIDQAPDFVVRRQQLEETLLVQMLSQKIARGMKAPTPADIQKFMAANPGMFAGRQIMTVDQLRFPMPTNPDFIKQLGATKTMPQVIAVLDQQGVKYERGPAQLDTVRLPTALLEQIRKVPQGEPFVLPAGNVVTVNLLTSATPAPLPAAAAQQLAANGVRQTQLTDALQQRLKNEKDTAKVEYQPGFAPPAAAGKPAAAK